MRLPRLLSLLLLPLLLVSCKKPIDPATAAKTFFDQVNSGQLKNAYDSAAFSFQAQQTYPMFEVTVKEMGLTAIESIKFDAPNVDARTAKLRADISTKNGDQFPLNVTLNEENGVWRIYSLRIPPTENGPGENRFSLVGKGIAFNNAASQPIPDEKTLKELALKTLLIFNQCVQQKSFDEFYTYVSKTWQQRLTTGQLQRAFQPFIDKEINISEIKNVEVILDPAPTITSSGLLVVSGRYPTKPYRVEFSLKFIYELPEWRLFGIDVNLRTEQTTPPATPPPQP